MIKLTIIGCTGRMGQMVIKEGNKNPSVEVVGALTRPGNPFIGQDIGDLIGEGPLNIPITEKANEALQKADVVVDFSHPEALEKHLKEATKQNKPYVVCMTGLNETQKENLKKSSQKLPLILAPNTSLGIVLLRKLTVLAAEILGPTYDVSILEMHHRHKCDAPSGTSLSLAQALTSMTHLKNNAPPYPSLSPRPLGTIECTVMRGGAVAGDHTVIFAGEKDILRLEHRSLDRALFAQGALRAAQWLFDKPPGFYTMDDVVGL